MAQHTNNRSGFTLIEVVILLAVVAVIGALGYTFYSRMNDQTAVKTPQSKVATDVPAAPEIKQADDLDKAESILDQTDPGASSSDLNQLDSASSGF